MRKISFKCGTRTIFISYPPSVGRKGLIYRDRNSDSEKGQRSENPSLEKNEGMGPRKRQEQDWLC